jgi:hypothetical protein
LAKVLGVSVQWCEDMHNGMPCARRVDGSAWWLDDDAALAVWKRYADVWNNPPEPPKPQPVRGVEGPSSSDRVFALLDAAGSRRRGTSPPDDAPTEGLP